MGDAEAEEGIGTCKKSEKELVLVMVGVREVGGDGGSGDGVAVVSGASQGEIDTRIGLEGFGNRGKIVV
jgi:hypothetical protein